MAHAAYWWSPMNILFLTSAYLPSVGGVQRSVYNLSREFARRGHSVSIAADGRYSGASGTASRREGPVRVLSLNIPPALRGGLRDGMSAWLRDAFNLSLLTAFCLLHRIDAIHCQLINVDTRYAFALRKVLGAKVMITLRGGEFHHWIEGNPLRRDYVARMLESADAVTALSAAQLEDARALTPRLPAAVRVIPNPVDPAVIAQLAEESSLQCPAVPYAVFVGRLEAEKRVDSLIAAFHQMALADPPFCLDLVIAGEGSLAARLRLQASEGGASQRIRFAGEVAYRDSLRLIRQAAMLILPSRMEGCPNVVLEAMALGAPVLVSGCAPLRELVRQGINGEVCGDGSPEEIRSAVVRLASSPELRERYSREGRRRVEEYHRFDRVADAYEDVWRSLREHAR